MNVEIEIKEEPLEWEEIECKPNIDNYPKSLEVIYKKHFPSGIEFVRVKDCARYAAPAPPRLSDRCLLPVQQVNLGVWIKEEPTSDEPAVDPLGQAASRREPDVGSPPAVSQDAAAKVKVKAKVKARVPSRPHGCDLCDARFATRQKLTTHSRVHSGERPFACDQCGLRFSQQCHARSHAKARHGGVGRSHACDTCGATFARSNHLADHRRTHTGEKPFACTQCDRRFSRRPHLVRHAASHTGARPNACDLCPATFSRRDDLERHVRGHTSDRRYACTECGRRFLASHHLKAHRRLHLATGARTWTCKICPGEFSSVGSLSAHTRRQHR